jgi:MFS transporter, PPP family, 3-phenylpropionic acid transporter
LDSLIDRLFFSVGPSCASRCCLVKFGKPLSRDHFIFFNNQTATGIIKHVIRPSHKTEPVLPIPPPRARVKNILSSQYFIYFGVMGIILPYFNLYCYHLGFTGFQIGVLSSVRTLATALFPLLWGVLADRLRIRRPIYIVCNIISMGAWSLYLLTTDFTAMLVITAFYGFFYAPIISFLESFSMDLLGEEKKGYGRLRAWGSLGFILMVVAAGRAIDASSTEIILVLVLAGSMLQALIAFAIPPVDGKKPSIRASALQPFMKRRTLIFLFCAFIMLFSHGTYYGFFSIHLENLGYSGIFIGMAWALASAAEILVMLTSERIFKRFSYQNILIFTFAAAGARWILMGLITSAPLILLAQLLHALTYGAFHVASILYMDELSPEDAKTTGQAINNAVTYGMGIMAGFLFNGYFFDIIGVPWLFFTSSLLAFFGGLVFCVDHRPRKRDLRHQAG